MSAAVAALPDGWTRTTLGAVLTGPRDLTYGIVQPGAHDPEGVPIVRVTDVRNGRVAIESPLRVEAAVAAPFQRSQLQGGELLITLVGTVGECAVAPNLLRGWNTARAVGVARVRPDVGADWVALCLSLRDVRDMIAARVNTTVQTTLNLKDLRELPIVLPQTAELKRIREFVAALNDKIESNRRMFSALQALGDLHVMSSGDTWVRLGDVGTLSMGSSPPGSSLNESPSDYPFFQGVRDFGFRHPARRVWTDHAPRLAQVNDTLISVRAPVGRLNRAVETCCIGRGVAALRSSWPSVVYYALRAAEDDWQPYRGEGTVFGSINRADLRAVSIRWPGDVEALVRLERVLSTIDARIDSLLREQTRLAALRDALLPELLSGRIRVPEAAESALA